MLSTIIVCAAATFWGSDAAVQPLPVASTQAVAISAKKPDPKASAVAPPKTDSAKTEQKPQPKAEKKAEQKPAAAAEQKTEKKFELLAIEQSVVDYTNAERARYGLPAFVVDPNLMATAPALHLDDNESATCAHRHGRRGKHCHGPADQPGRSSLLDEFVPAIGRTFSTAVIVASELLPSKPPKELYSGANSSCHDCPRAVPCPAWVCSLKNCDVLDTMVDLRNRPIGTSVQ